MVIDTETHVVYRVFPREINPSRSRVWRFTWHEYSGDLLVDEMNRAGVDKTFLISYDAEDILWYLETEGATSEDCIAGERYTRSFVDRYPNRFLWFCTLKHPHKYDVLTMLRKNFTDGALGVKIFPSYLNLDADDPSLMDVYRLCVQENRRLILSFEDTLPPKTPSVTGYWHQLDGILAELPELRVQVNHAGAGASADPASDPLNDEAELIFDVTNRHANVLLSTAWLGKVWDDETEYPFPRYLSRLRRLVEACGTEKLMWATDWPWLEVWMNYPQSINSIRKHADFMTETEKEQFLGGNAERFVAGVGS
jgi:predicted TIM-barrel fold metal-dependent hydrolase